MNPPFSFVEMEDAFHIHAAGIEAFGGSHGIRDEGALESALNAARQRAYYEEATIAVCAATYAYHLTNAHAFIDGNKRVAAGVTFLFIRDNDYYLSATDDELYDLIMGIADKTISREATEAFFTERVSVNS